MKRISGEILITMFVLFLTAEAFSSTHHIMVPSIANKKGLSHLQSSHHRNMKTNGKNKSNTNIHESRKSMNSSNTAMQMSLAVRGGSTIASTLTSSPTNLFNTNLVVLGLATAIIRIFGNLNSRRNASVDKSSSTTTTSTKPASVKSLQIRFLAVFWLLRCADWLQGPYFYEVYSSKVFNGVPASLAIVSKLFLTGFASTAFFGPFVGRLSDSKGRKRGTLAFALLYSLGAASTKSNLLYVLLMGRVMSGIGTSLLFSAPEAWLVGEATKDEKGEGGKYLGETFGLVCCCMIDFLTNTYICVCVCACVRVCACVFKISIHAYIGFFY